MKNNEIEMQPLVRFRLDGGTQARMKLDENVVNEYAEAMARGEVFPPIVAFDDGNALWLADGFHRLAACRKIGKEAIATDRREGSQREAILFSLGANASHGLHRSNADKRKAVETMIKDTQWSQWSNCDIARRCGVSESMVRQVRASQPSLKTRASNNKRKYVDPRTGKEIIMDTTKMAANGDSSKSRQIKKRLAGIKSGLSDDLNVAAHELLGVKGKSYCQSLIDTLGQLVQVADSQEVGSNE